MDPEPNQEMGTIPGPVGLPLLGNLPQFLPNPMPQIKRLHRRYGNVFYAGFARNRRSVFMLGPEATSLVLIDQAAAFSNRLGYAGQSAFLGKNAILFRDGQDHRVLRQTMNRAFRPAALDRYLDTMNRHACEQIQRFGRADFGADVNAEVRLMSLNIAAEVIAGARLDADAAFINENFVSMLKGMVGLSPRLPGSRAWKGARSRKRLDQFFRSQIPDRRNSASPDLFTELCIASKSIGMSDNDVTDNMLGMLVAAYETTASTISMMLYLLARHPEWQQRLRAEADRLLGTPGRFNRRELDGLAEMEWVFKETLRLYPPLSFFPRRSTRPVEIEGHVIPANTSVTLAPAFTHQMESIYSTPELFDPTRFSPSRAEDKSHACAWMPFGKGPHTCMGMAFARMEIKIFFVNLLCRYGVELNNQSSPSMNYVPVLRPTGPLPLRFTLLS